MYVLHTANRRQRRKRLLRLSGLPLAARHESTVTEKRDRLREIGFSSEEEGNSTIGCFMKRFAEATLFR